MNFSRLNRPGPGMEYVITGEEIRVNDEPVLTTGSAAIFGEVEIIRRGIGSGNKIFTSVFRNHNELLLTGMNFLSEKVNNMRSSFQPSPIDVSLGVHGIDEIAVTDETVKDEKICGVMIGNDGCGDVYNTVHPVYRTDLTVPGMIPFRVRPVDDDLDTHTRDKYFLRTVRNGYAYYYGKKFSYDREIEVLYDDGRIVNSTNISRKESSQAVKAFTTYQLVIDEFDIREYFKLTQGSTKRSLMNSIGLLSGYRGAASDGAYDEYFNVKGLTTANLENMEFKNQNDSARIRYRLYFL